MVIFKPYSFVNTNNPGGWFSPNPSMAYGTKIVAWMGARRCGKTFHALKYCIKKFIYKNEPFAWLRDNDEARSKLAANNGAKFFEDVSLMDFKQKVVGSINGNTIFINGKTAGYLMPSSTFQNFKGNSFNSIKNAVYDEFIPEIGVAKKESRSWEVINMLYTIFSTRDDGRLLMLSNSLSISDEILQILGIQINKGYGIYINREKDVALHYCDNSIEFKKKQENSIIGKLIKGSYMEDNLFNNKFLDEDPSLYYKKRPSKCKVIAVLDTGTLACRVYSSPSDGLLYVSDHFNSEAYTSLRYVNDLTMVNSSRTLIPKFRLDQMKSAFNSGLIRFSNGLIKDTFVNFISSKR